MPHSAERTKKEAKKGKGIPRLIRVDHGTEEPRAYLFRRIPLGRLISSKIAGMQQTACAIKCYKRHDRIRQELEDSYFEVLILKIELERDPGNQKVLSRAMTLTERLENLALDMLRITQHECFKNVFHITADEVAGRAQLADQLARLRDDLSRFSERLR